MFRSAQHDSASFIGRAFKQLEFVFPKTDSLTSILSLRERRTTQSPSEGNSNALRLGRDVDLESKARQLLRQLGAAKLAREIRVEWNPRLRTCAGRADFREKLISLNPVLLDVRAGLWASRTDMRETGGKLDCLKQSSTPSAPDGHEQLDCFKQSSLTNVANPVGKRSDQHAWLIDEIERTLRHELAHLLAQFRVGRRRIAPHGAEWRRACRDLGI